MDLAFSAEDDEFRDEVRTWLAENTPSERRPREGQAMRDYDLAWQRLQSSICRQVPCRDAWRF